MPLFSKASGFSVDNGTFTDNSITTNLNLTERKPGPDRPGLERLLDKSIPAAAHDSSDRHPPPLCHPGTRDELIEKLVTWGHNADDSHAEGIAWVNGPAGAGKSALSQSSADRLGEDLAASFFFSRPNLRSDPKRFLTTIAYQLAVKHEPYGKHLDEKIRKDSTILTKSLQVQFRELIVVPIREVLGSGVAFPGKVVIVDGLDECEGTGYQGEILDIIARSVTEKTTPFRWIIASRLEPHIVSQFNHPDIKPVTYLVEVTISRDLDPAIFRFLADKLADIRRKHGLDESWPCEGHLHTLVGLSSGMFAYAHVISLFIDDDNSTSPMKQLSLVLDLAKRTNTEGEHPLKRLDLFYVTLILERLPLEKSEAIRLILLVNYLLFGSRKSRLSSLSGRDMSQSSFSQGRTCANVLGHSEQEFRLLCRSFHAVMVLDGYVTLKFYHASFMDFLLDPARSGLFCLKSPDLVMKLLDRAKQALDEIRLDSNLEPIPRLSWGYLSKEDNAAQYYSVITSFLNALELTISAGKVDDPGCATLQEWDFRKLLLLEPFKFQWGKYKLSELGESLSTQGGNLIQPYATAILGHNLPHFLVAIMQVMFFGMNSFVLGQGGKRVSLECFTTNISDPGFVIIRPYSPSDLEKFKEVLYEKSRTQA